MNNALKAPGFLKHVPFDFIEWPGSALGDLAEPTVLYNGNGDDGANRSVIMPFDYYVELVKKVDALAKYAQNLTDEILNL